MSIRSSMATSYGIGMYPEKMTEALGLRGSSYCACPADVDAKLTSIPFFRKTAGAAAPACRFPTFSNTSEGFSGGSNRVWRGGNGGHASAGGADEDGFQMWSSRRRGGGGGGGGGRILPHAVNSFAPRREEHAPHGAGAVYTHATHKRHESVLPPATAAAAVATATGMVVPAAVAAVAAVAADEPIKFSSAAVKAGVDMEERILARVKGKINKIGFSTYDATKSFMQQILDSDEIGFLDELMNFIFQKAATESTFCPLYARLLHELADEFGHIRVVMRKLFTDYTAIFTEMNTAPDVGTSDYKAFVEAQERKKFRRGYSQFVAELVKYGEADGDAFANLLRQILSVLEESYTVPDRSLTCEEYVDCLANMCSAAGATLSAAVSSEIRGRLDLLVKKARSESPGVTNKCRFAMMDILDLGKKGWKK